MTGAIRALADRMGIWRKFTDFTGQVIVTPPDTTLALLHAMLPEVEDGKSAAAMLAALAAEDAARAAPAYLVVAADNPAELGLRRPARWELLPEGAGAATAGGCAEDRLTLPALPAGVHALTLDAGGGRHTTWLIAAPPAAPSVADLTGRARIWGVTAPLWGLASARNLGIGDYRDLGDMAAALAGHGAQFLGINPVHAIGPTPPAGPFSPYSPTHRGFLNDWHIAVDDLERFGGGRPPVDGPGRAGPLVDYAAVALLRDPALAAAFARFEELDPGSDPCGAFAAFAADRGRALSRFAGFETLAARFGPDWRVWPAPFRDPASDEVAAHLAAHPSTLRFALWKQWVADGQLASAQARARKAGMALGLYLDLAIGPRPGGAETWAGGQSHVHGATMGAPPDPLSDRTQSWGLAPLSPPGLAREGFRPFADLLGAVMRHAGMIRIDHVLGLSRAYWIPEGGGPGAYVTYPFDALVAVTQIEAQRSRTLVVGEDLGLVPAGFRDRLARAGLYGLDIMQFERDGTGGFRAVEQYRPRALAAFGTHDTPTLAGFFAARDADVLRDLGRITEDERCRLRDDRSRLAGDVPACDLAGRVHGKLANAASAMVAVQLDDVAGEADQQNIPGTVGEYPNWRRRTAIPVEDAPGEIRLARLGGTMAAAGRGA